MADNFNTYSSLKIDGWRQFKNVDIEFHDRLTIITGANGAGKTTILRILGIPFGNADHFLATPTMDERGMYRYFNSLAKAFKNFFKIGLNRNNIPAELGKLYYSGNKTPASLMVPNSTGPQYQITLSNPQPLQGMRIRSHRTQSMYRQLASIPISHLGPHAAFMNYINEIRHRRIGVKTNSSPAMKLKEALLSMAIFGEGNSKVRGNLNAKETYNDFLEVLRKLLPPSLGFRTLDIRTPDIVMVTDTGEFLLDSSSGGISSLIDIAFQIHLFSQYNGKFVVTIDEPENHLHPSLQKNLLPSLLECFPKAQFIISTHSPFMVTSVQDSSVYVLRYENMSVSESNEILQAGVKAQIVAEKLDIKNKAGNADDVLRNVLGVENTLPVWVSNEIDKVIEKYKNKELTAEVLSDLRRSMDELGLSKYYVEALSKVTYND